MTRRRSLLAFVAALSAVPAAAGAQTDVQELGRIYGTTPPEAYFETLRTNPDAFQFRRALLARNPRLQRLDAGDGPPEFTVRAEASAATGGPLRTLGRRDGPVEGTFRFPLLLGYYADMGAPPPYSRALVQREFFDGPNSRYKTIPEFYEEISGGRVQLEGVTIDWEQSSLTGAAVTGGVSGLGGGRVGEFIHHLLEAADDGTLDWGQFDNDGPDGVPNSGDDDGWVDVLTVFHPWDGAECSGNLSSLTKIWSHKWNLASWSTGTYTTSTPSANGGFIRVDDYTIQPVRNCGGEAINEIGVFAHELGHGFGLPDLYCTAPFCAHEGIGRWGLMGSGSWGCGSFDPSRPCHMNAWSKVALGWADVVDLDPGLDLGTLTLPAVETSGRIYRVDAQDGSGEYFLLENRQRLGFDQGIPGAGLLVWHIDGPLVQQRWTSNSVNYLSGHLGVWLRQADGLGQIESTGSGGNPGDAGDPFPGSTGNPSFHASGNPRSFTHDDNPSGLTLVEIAHGASQSMTFRALTRFQTIELRTEGGTTGGLLTVDGSTPPGTTVSFSSAPFQIHHVEAAAGEPVGPGRRHAFERWLDDEEAPRARTLVTGFEDRTLTARYSDLQLELAVDLTGGAFDVEPGRIVSDPASDDLWFPEGSVVSLTAEPTPGFAFLGWGGDLASSPNPVTVVLSAPIEASALFELTYALPADADVVLEAGTAPESWLATPDGTAPFTWTRLAGSLPAGLELIVDGRLQGVPMEEGTFPLQLRVTDANGLEATGAITLVVTPPDLDLAALAAPLLGTGTPPSGSQLLYLDHQGNDDGSYDVGDLRTFLLAHPDLPAAVAATRGEIVLPFVLRPGGSR